MNHPDALVNVLGLLYGAVLIAAAFMRTGVTEALRIDALFMREYSEKTRPLNLLAGALVAGYAMYSLSAEVTGAARRLTEFASGPGPVI